MGGYSIGVFDPEKNNRKNVSQLYNDHRINFYAPADYSARGKLSIYIKHIIDEISSREVMKKDQMAFRKSAIMFEAYQSMKSLKESMPLSGTGKLKKNINTYIEEIKKNIDGNID